MAVAFDIGSQSTRTATTDPYTFTHTPTGTPRGVVVGAVHGASSTDHILTISYGGVNMGRVVRAVDTATEAGAAELWFLGSNIPGTGGVAQTISIDFSSATTDDFHFQCFTLTAAGNTEVIDFDKIEENAANPTVTLQKGGRTGWCVAGMYGGGAAPGGTLAGGADNTLGGTADLGNFYSQFCRETTIDSSDHTIGWSTLASDDLAFVALCVSEVPAAVANTPRWRRKRADRFLTFR